MPAVSKAKQEFPAEYKVWKGMKDRCFNKNSNVHKFYGGRGILVCETWSDSFSAFIRDMGPRPSDEHTTV